MVSAGIDKPNRKRKHEGPRTGPASAMVGISGAKFAGTEQHRNIEWRRPPRARSLADEAETTGVVSRVDHLACLRRRTGSRLYWSGDRLAVSRRCASRIAIPDSGRRELRAMLANPASSAEYRRRRPQVHRETVRLTRRCFPRSAGGGLADDGGAELLVLTASAAELAGETGNALRLDR